MNKQNVQKWILLAPFFLAICMLAGCAAKTAPVYGDPQTGVILQYRMPEGQVLKYDSWGETHQVSDVMGQTIETDISSTSVFTVKSNGQEENNHQLTITIDGMSLKIQSTQAELEPDMSTVIGKSFDMVFSSLGKEVELIGADSIEYDLGPEGTRNISSGFQDVFPNLADRPVKVGDSWPDESTITEESDRGETIIHFTGTNTLVGFETIEGVECAKITAEGTGTIESKGEQQGVELVTTGEIKGTATWYFAYKEGIFIKQINEGTVEGTVDVPSQGVQIPFTREASAEIKLVK
ncbi:MAG: hypothetical protein JSV17_07855 [Candidatus Aminicenantes bacterium]|nr:MAG: hypothetical protein JSV17_07855 [Candidatus Aminicenantes bacterium]